MKARAIWLIATFIVIAALTGTAFGEVPQTVSYQGRVTDALGQPIDSTVDVTFYLYADSLGVEQIWSETHASVQIADGLFTVLLGSINTTFRSYFGGKERWLGVQLGSGPITSRLVPMVSTAYAFKTQKSDTASYASKAQKSDTSSIANTVADNSITTAKIVNGTILLSDIGQNSATSGEVIKWNGSAWEAQADDAGSNTSGWEDDGTVVRLDYSSDSVGIGTTAPVEKLHVNGEVRVKSRVEFGDDSLNVHGANGDLYLSSSDDLYLQFKEYLFFGVPGATSWIRVDNVNERLGIGTTGTVDEMLQVENKDTGGRSFLQIETSHATGFGEAGIRIKTPQNTWHLRMDDVSNNNIPSGALALRSGDGATEAMTWAESGNVGIGTTDPGLHSLYVVGTASYWAGAALRAETSADNGVAAYCYSNSTYPTLVSAQKGTGDIFRGYTVDDADVSSLVTRIKADGRVVCPVLELTGGSDVAEPFKIADSKDLPAGSLVVIDDSNPGGLRLADSPYDTRVAGVVSGAGGVNPGITLSQKGVNEGGRNVAISGRVFCLADASYGSIKPGDLLTTSPTKGHAMVASDREKAYGTVIGKAMSSLESGTGLVLILVSLQ